MGLAHVLELRWQKNPRVALAAATNGIASVTQNQFSRQIGKRGRSTRARNDDYALQL
jgi:hypothetical protein